MSTSILKNILPGSIGIGGVNASLKGGTPDPSINNFLSKLGDGLQMPNRFRLEFFLPRGIIDLPNPLAFNITSTVGAITAYQIYMNQDEKINVFCHTAAFPMRSLSVWDHKMWSAPYKVPNSQNFEPVTFGFYADSDMNTRRYFDAWMSAVINLYSNTTNYYDEFVSDVNIIALDREGNDTYRVTLREAYPLNIGAVDLSYANRNSVTTVNVTMTYKLWSAETFGADIGPVHVGV